MNSFICCNKSHHDHVLLLAMHACCERIDTYQVYSFFLFSYTVLGHCISCGTERMKRRLSCFSHRAVASLTSCGECFSAVSIRDEHSVCVYVDPEMELSMLHLFHFTCNDLCTWLPMNAPPLYCLHLETGELLPLPSQRVPQTQLTLFLASAIICSYMHKMHAHVWVHVHCCVTLHKIPPPPPPPPIYPKYCIRGCK